MDDAKWYVVHTYSGYENKVKANIEKTVENRNLHDQILEVIVPLETVVEIKDGSKKAAQKKMFPGYVLVKMVMNDDSWYVVRNTRGVTGFVGSGTDPIPLSDEEIRKKLNRRNSITVIAAPTGEGKTTTLYSIIDYLNNPSINITTIEDPVEIRIPGLNQIEISERLRFSDSLRTVLRQDPDIVLVGEIRDKETAEIAMQAGQTGHYVLSTIHTIDAIEVVTRLRKMGLSDYDIASTVGTTISQRLLRKICPHCKREREFTDYEKEVIQKIGEKYDYNFNLDGVKTYDAVGCDKCNNSGYYDRIGIFEVLNIDDDIRQLIMEGKSSIEIRKKAMEKSYRPLIVDGINKVLKGETNLGELNKKLIIFNSL